MKLFNVLGVAFFGALGTVAIAATGAGCSVTTTDSVDGGSSDTGTRTDTATDTPATGATCATACAAAAKPKCSAEESTDKCTTDCNTQQSQGAAKGCSSQINAYIACASNATFSCDSTNKATDKGACDATLNAAIACLTPAQTCGQCQDTNCATQTNACTAADCQKGITCLNAATTVTDRNACFNTNSNDQFAALGVCLQASCKAACFQ